MTPVRPLQSVVTPEELRNLYKGQERYLRALVAGAKGAGKTTFAVETSPRPVWLCSFDPAGEQSVLDAKGDPPEWLIPDTRYQANDAQAFASWARDLETHAKRGDFDNIGTYILDSTTTWADALLAKVLGDVAGKPRADGKGTHSDHMERPDWGTFLEQARYYLKSLANLPCHVIVTGHIKETQDDVTSEIIRTLAIPGQTGDLAPVWFSEVWFLMVKYPLGASKYNPDSPAKHADAQRYLITGNDGRYKGATRMGRKGVLDLHERPDVTYLLKKAGWLKGESKG